MKTLAQTLSFLATGVITLTLSAAPAAAHSITDGGSGFATGFSHPFSGFDHLVAIVGVGLLAALHGRKALLSTPAFFIAAMALGAIFPLAGVTIYGAEFMIILSLLAIGCLLASVKWIGLLRVNFAVSVFAFFHGAAHGNEMAGGLLPHTYVVGFIASAIMLMAMGAIVAKPATMVFSRLAWARESL